MHINKVVFMSQAYQAELEQFRERFVVITKKVASAIEAITYILHPDSKLVSSERDKCYYAAELEHQTLYSVTLLQIPVSAELNKMDKEQQSVFMTVLLPYWDKFLKTVYESATNVLEHYEILRKSHIGVYHHG